MSDRWWKQSETEKFCPYLSTAETRIPCQRADCLSFRIWETGGEKKEGCRDELMDVQRQEGLQYDQAILQDQERILKIGRGLTRLSLTGEVSEELLAVTQIEGKVVKRLDNSS